MQRSVILPLACALAWGGVCLGAPGAEDALPRPAAADRYARMADRSPFAPPTVAPPPGQGPTPILAGPKWSDDLVLTLLTQQGGVYFATIQDKAKNDHFLLQTNKEDTERHLALASVQWGELVDQTTVTLRHNSEFASVRFDPNSTPAPAAPVAPVAPLAPKPGRGPVPGSYPAPPPPGRLQPPPLPPPGPPGAPNVQRRPNLIRTTPTVTSPPNPPPGASRGAP